MADLRDVEHRVAVAVARYLDTASFDEVAAHTVAMPELSTWLGALIQPHLEQELSWPAGWTIDDAAPGWMEPVGDSTVRVAGLAWLLTDERGGAQQQPFAGLITLAPARGSLSSYQLNFGDATVGVDSRASSERDRSEWPIVSRWLFNFASGDIAGH